MKSLILSTWSKFGPIRRHIVRDWFTVIHYHRIEPDLFKEHLEYYKKYFYIDSLNNIFIYFKDKTQISKNPIFITFDDGWKSNFDLMPLIESEQMPVTIFLSTGLIGTNKKPHPITFYETKSNSKRHEYPSENERTMLSLEEIKEMVKIVNFQSHGVNHHLSTHITPNQFRSELLESKQKIENITRKKVYAFAYPYNRAGQSEAKIVESCGYTIARAGGRMMNDSNSKRFLINSIGIEEKCTVKDLKKKLLRAELKTTLIGGK